MTDFHYGHLTWTVTLRPKTPRVLAFYERYSLANVTENMGTASITTDITIWSERSKVHHKTGFRYLRRQKSSYITRGMYRMSTSRPLAATDISRAFVTVYKARFTQDTLMEVYNESVIRIDSSFFDETQWIRNHSLLSSFTPSWHEITREMV